MALGSASFINVGKETTWGTFPAAGARRKAGVASFNISQRLGLIPDDTLQGGRSRKGYFAGAQSAAGRIVLPMRYENCLWALEGVLGSAVSAIASGETFIWEHVIKEGLVLPSYSLELGEADVPTGKVARVLGAKIASCTFRIVPGQTEEAYGHLELEIVAKDKDTLGTTGHPPTTSFTTPAAINNTAGQSTYTRASGSFITEGVTVGQIMTGTGLPAGTWYVLRVANTGQSITIGDSAGTLLTTSTGATNAAMTFATSLLGSLPNSPMPPLFFHSATTGSAEFPGIMNVGNDAGATKRVRRVEIAIANPLSEIYHMESQNIDEPIPEDFYTVRWTMEHEFKNLNMYNDAKNNAVMTPRLRLTSPLAITGATDPNERRFIEFRANTSKVAEYEVPVEGPGIVTANVIHESYYDPTDTSALTIVARNLDPNVSI